MSEQNTKTLLHESIENINDEDFLFAVKQILDRKYLPVDQPNLAPEQVQRIEESKTQIQQGNFFTAEQADEQVDRWLNE